MEDLICLRLNFELNVYIDKEAFGIEMSDPWAIQVGSSWTNIGIEDHMAMS